MHLILASASARRAELLTSAGFTFVVEPADVDESVQPGEEPARYALRVARNKAWARAAPDGDVAVLAADTVVVVDGQILGKPRDRDDARRMLEALSGRVHDVLTAVVLRAGSGAERSEVVTTRVHVAILEEADVASYLATGEWEGKAGGYGIQGHAARYIERIEGSWSNVVGLPIATVHRLINGFGG